MKYFNGYKEEIQSIKFVKGDIIQNVIIPEKLYLIIDFDLPFMGYKVQTIEGRKTYHYLAINTFYVKVGEL